MRDLVGRLRGTPCALSKVEPNGVQKTLDQRIVGENQLYVCQKFAELNRFVGEGAVENVKLPDDSVKIIGWVLAAVRAEFNKNRLDRIRKELEALGGGAVGGDYESGNLKRYIEQNYFVGNVSTV